jgi:nitroimidazol reductase NimA-like FMN-containing flavoprotein (pyridoxamine 5'-phosphate oxidase superfamily)
MWIDQRGSEVLDPSECRRLLALAAKQGGIGRLGVSLEAAPIIRPVNFAYDAEHGHRVLVRLGEGALAEAAGGALVSFEVDHIDPDGAWSVLVRGLLVPISSKDGDKQLEGRAPHPLVPIPGHKVFALRSDVVTGRRFQLIQGDR